MKDHRKERAEARKKAEKLVSQMTLLEKASQLKYDAAPVKRLGVPAYNYWNEALHGVARAGVATMFPQAIAMAAVFDDEEMKKVGDIIATEGRAKYNAYSAKEDRDIYKGLTFWSPNVNIFRDPRWGRGHETYGEDPYLTSRLGVKFVEGIQGDGPVMKAAACAKHYAVHSGPESLRHEFDAQASMKDIPYSVVECKEHIDEALKMARKSCVLLKNDGVLPIDKTKVNTIGVIGPNADSRAALIGNYHGTSSEYITVLEGIREEAGDDVRILYSQGCDLYKDKVENLAWDQDRISEAVITAENSDVVILCVGLDETLEGEEGDTGNSDASGDKVDLHLPKVQEELIEKVTAVGKPTIVVLMAGSAIDLNYAQDNCNGILLAWYPGARGGRAVADLLFGKESPSGKLPVTFYKDLEGMPEFTDYSMKNRTYRYMEKEALYPFGYGLTYSDTCVTEAEVVGEVSAESDIVLKATVKNNGTVDTDEVVQVYIKDLDSPLAVRNYSLCGFKRVSLKAGEEKSVEFTISNKAMNIVDEDGNRYIAGKHFRLFAGVSQPDTRSAELTGHKPAEIEIAL